jgi:dynein light chain roadblock-type
VIASVCVNSDGVAVRPPKNMDAELADVFAKHVKQLADKARSVVRDLDPQNDLKFMRIRSRTQEVLISNHDKFMFAVVQDPSIPK